MESSKGFFIFLGIAGAIGLVAWMVSRGSKSQAAPATYSNRWIQIDPQEPSPESVSVQPVAQDTGYTTYSNTEETTFPDGFDPDTLMPRKIMVHRVFKVLSRG